jgi:hypothetical protein
MISIRSKRILFVFLALLSCVTSPLFGANQKKEMLVIHVKTLADQNNQFFFIPQLALRALETGHRVAILFDAKGVMAIKIGHWYGGDTTVLDKIGISKEERASLAGQLGLSPASAPSNHGEFLRLLRGKGVELYANEEMMRTYRIAKDKYDTSVIPVGLDRMMELLREADAYLSY